MGETIMKKLSNQFKEQLGWQGISGIVLLALAGVFQMLALKPLEQEVTFMRSHLDTSRTKTSMQSRTFSLGDRQKELGMFFDSLPSEEDVTDILASIYSVAEASGVGLKQAEYHPDSDGKTRVQYGMVFPVQGEYAKIRYFVARVLADNPAIAMDQINFQRDKISDPILKAEIRFTLFLRQAK
jgi:Tfp pilus assembly protein PilO